VAENSSARARSWRNRAWGVAAGAGASGTGRNSRPGLGRHGALVPISATFGLVDSDVQSWFQNLSGARNV
jgi:hypothetical protein